MSSSVIPIPPCNCTASYEMYRPASASFTLSAAQAAGAYRAPSLETEGFIHFSTKDQVLATANWLYHGQTGLVLLAVDCDRLTAPLKYDEVPGHGTFPHLYGALNIDAVVKVFPFSPDEAGYFSMPAV